MLKNLIKKISYKNNKYDAKIWLEIICYTTTSIWHYYKIHKSQNPLEQWYQKGLEIYCEYY